MFPSQLNSTACRTGAMKLSSSAKTNLRHVALCFVLSACCEDGFVCSQGGQLMVGRWPFQKGPGEIKRGGKKKYHGMILGEAYML